MELIGVLDRAEQDAADPLLREQLDPVELSLGIVGAGGDLQAEPGFGEVASMLSSSRTVCGLSSTTIAPIAVLRPPRSCWATWSGVQPSRVIAARTRCNVFGDTLVGWFTTLETVPAETPASIATS